MLIGFAPLPKHEFEIKCAYSGCDGTKRNKIMAKMLGFNIELSLAGLTQPYFEDALRSKNNGGDLSADSVLRVKWNRLNFFTDHWFLGRVEINMRTLESAGRVWSLENPSLTNAPAWLGDLPKSTGSFFPAYNENHLYFSVSIPRFGLTFENKEPVVNGAVINEIPPLGTNYKMKQPAVFKATNRFLPLSVVIEECQMAMATLKNIKLEVVEFVKLENSPL